MNSKLREALELCDKIMSDVVVGTRDISPLEAFDEMSGIIDKALTEPLRNCDMFKSEYDADKLHEAFVKYCNACDCPMGCIHRRDTRCMLDTRCGSILKCFAKFVLSETKGGAK